MKAYSGITPLSHVLCPVSLAFSCQMSDVMCPVSCVLFPLSCFLCPVSLAFSWRVKADGGIDPLSCVAAPRLSTVGPMLPVATLPPPQEPPTYSTQVDIPTTNIDIPHFDPGKFSCCLDNSILGHLTRSRHFRTKLYSFTYTVLWSYFRY